VKVQVLLGCHARIDHERHFSLEDLQTMKAILSKYRADTGDIAASS
jgi:hypothetical protein